MANDAIMKWGSATNVIVQNATVADGEVVGGQTELDNSTTLYPLAMAVITIPDAFGGTPAGSVDLYMVRGDIDGTTNGTALAYAALTTSDNITDPEYAEYCGSWNLDQNEAVVAPINISLNGVQYAKFYIMNNTGQTLVATGSPGLYVKITPFTFTPST